MLKSRSNLIYKNLPRGSSNILLAMQNDMKLNFGYNFETNDKGHHNCSPKLLKAPGLMSPHFGFPE